MGKTIDELLELQEKRIVFRKRFSKLEEEMGVALRNADSVKLEKINDEYGKVLKEYKKMLGGFK